MVLPAHQIKYVVRPVRVFCVSMTASVWLVSVARMVDVKRIIGAKMMEIARLTSSAVTDSVHRRPVVVETLIACQDSAASTRSASMCSALIIEIVPQVFSVIRTEHVALPVNARETKIVVRASVAKTTPAYPAQSVG